MKDIAHHRQFVQKKILQNARAGQEKLPSFSYSNRTSIYDGEQYVPDKPHFVHRKAWR